MRKNPNPNHHLVTYVDVTVCIDGNIWIYPAELVIRQTFKYPKKK
jgi:hypothetical protein